MEYFYLAIAWIFWCVVHSVLISLKFSQFLQEKLKEAYRFFRLFYNIFSILTFAIIIYYSWRIKGKIVFSWEGYSQIIQWILLLASFYLFWAGAKSYDIKQFLGLSQIKNKNSSKTLSPDDEISISGIMGKVRHPWYVAGILFIWTISSDIYMSSLATNIIFTTYLILGAFIEEKKLIAVYGDQYRRYQKNVAMFFPRFRSKV